MTNDFERFIRDAEGELSATRDTLNAYEKERRELEARFRSENPRYQQVCDKCQQWREEVSFAQRHLDRARRIMAGSPALPPHPALAKADKPKPMPNMVEPAPAVQQEEVTVKPSLPFPHGPFKSFPPAPAPVHAGFDRANAKRAVRAWRSSYPLAASYRNSSRFERQALSAEIVNHPDYDAWLDKGNHSVTDPKYPRTYPETVRAASELGIDIRAVRSKAREVHLDISSYGTQGVDYLWSDK